ncbi:MAG: hypothetical protein KKE36_07540, partial [Actinobacteria bacterium]|nr:hypothetical protein [Actinomycetota bacterium]
PTTTGNHTTDGTGTGTFTSSITVLSPGTLYHVRAYATNSVGTSYGDDLTFTTDTTPTVATTAATNVTSTTADSGGNVTADGGDPVTARGVCWSTSPNPTTTGNHTTDGTGTGTFTSSITVLSPGTLYHVRAYATNSVGTAYGSQEEFTTDAVVPTLTTSAATSITTAGATLNGNITSTGGENADQRGFRYRKDGTTNWTDWAQSGSYGTGTFLHPVTGLSPGTAYEYQAGGHNSAGWSYGGIETFTTVSRVTPTTWYLAEGTTDWGFSTSITVTNPNNRVVDLDITYMPCDAEAGNEEIQVPPLSQTTLTNDHLLTVVGKNDFSTRIECAGGYPMAVDRTMTWIGPGALSPEGHSSIGVTEPSTTWYMPEGTSDWGFETWLLIQNPNDGPANCTITYMVEGGTPVVKTEAVPASSRRSYSMFDHAGIVDASIQVASDKPVICERSVYRHNRREGHESIGTTAPAPAYYLAEGTTDWGFTTYVLIQNPNPGPVDVNVTYLTGEGEKAHPRNPVHIEASSRKTIRVNDFLPGSDFSTKVESTGNAPIIAERAMYWGEGTTFGEACHDSIGLCEPHTTFYLPDGQADSSCETWTLVANPNSEDVKVTIAYLTATGEGNVTEVETIPANTRRTFNMAWHSGLAGRASIVVTCTTSGKKIMAERAMYWHERGAGTDTVGGTGD